MTVGIGWLGRIALAVAGSVLLSAAGPPPPEQRGAPPEQKLLPPQQRALPAALGRRVALVVGNSAYQHTAALANPRNDASDMAGALERTGFEVIVALDAGKTDMDRALRAFADKVASADVALFYYAGHGLQVGNQNFLVPVEARLARERDLEFEAVKLDFVLRQMEIDRDGKTTIVMLDACRDNPLTRNLARSMGTRSTAVGQGLAPAATGVGTFIAYSTQPGNVALDGAGRNSPFTAALLSNLAVTGRNLNATMIEVRKAVIGATNGRQVPWDHSALTGDFYFVPAAGAVAGGVTPSAKGDDVAALRARLKALEEEADRRREAAASDQRDAKPPTSSEIMRLAEARARLAVAEDKAKDLQLKLLDARRVEGQATDPAERQRLQQAAMRIQMDMTRASLDARRLKDEIATMASPAPGTALTANVETDHRPAPGLPPVQPKARAAPLGEGFDVADNVRIDGDTIRSFRSPSPAACQEACGKEAGCVAFRHRRKIPVMGQCHLLSVVSSRHEDAAWRSGARQ
ncbi:MAG: caspase family protein [Hyphomicrobiaceae bacterium]|nr:caspase family protein [Hyphomicrobiaceae bacterium]